MSDTAPQISFRNLWQKAFDSLWNQISPFIAGREQRELAGIGKCEINEVWMNGGRSSGKSFTCAEWIVMAMNNDPYKNAVVVRKFKSSIRNSCYEQVWKAILKLGQSHCWKRNNTLLTLENVITKQKILFVGLDDEEKVRSLTISTGYFSIVWFEEAKQFASYEELVQAKSSILRGSADGGIGNDEVPVDAEFMTFITYNPPRSRHEWINQEASRPSKGRVSHHSTYLTMPRAWVGSNIIAEAERLKRDQPLLYRYIYLGEPVGCESTYFKNIEVRPITDEERAMFPYFDMGIDWGEIDPNVFSKVYDDGEGTVYVFDEVYQDEQPMDGSPKIKEFAKLVYEKTRDCPDDPIFADAQGKTEAEWLRRPPYNLYVQSDTAKHGDNSRDAGYRYLQKRSKIVICSKTAPKIARDFELFECETLPNGRPIDKPGKFGDHGTDCVRYALWKQIKYGSY
jgi:PBSX family phage terminase large subunit